MVLVETLNCAEQLIWTCSCRHHREKKPEDCVFKIPRLKVPVDLYVLLSEFAIKFKSCTDVLLCNDMGLAVNTLQLIFRLFFFLRP